MDDAETAVAAGKQPKSCNPWIRPHTCTDGVMRALSSVWPTVLSHRRHMLPAH